MEPLAAYPPHVIALCLLLCLLSFSLCLPLTWAVRTLSHRLGAHDSAPLPGQIKAAARRVPNTGGIAIFLSLALPLAIGALAVLISPELVSGAANVVGLGSEIGSLLPGLAESAPKVLIFLAALLIIHVLGLIDDRRPLGPRLKLAIMVTCVGLVIILTDTRLLMLLDSTPLGTALSFFITLLWMVIICNAMNFMDNTDGLTAGVSAIAGLCFLAAAVQHQQWFISAALALLIGACLGFLVFNFPSRLAGPDRRASIFMGDGGSLVLGFTLAFLTVRTTYIGSPGALTSTTLPSNWYALFMPILVMAVPLYDLVSVCIIRIRAGRSPMVGDLNHLSHRLMRHGLPARDAVLLIYALTGITAIGGIFLGSLTAGQAMLVVIQALLVLLALALFESRRKPSPASASATTVK